MVLHWPFDNLQAHLHQTAWLREQVAERKKPERKTMTISKLHWPDAKKQNINPAYGDYGPCFLANPWPALLKGMDVLLGTLLWLFIRVSILQHLAASCRYIYKLL